MQVKLFNHVPYVNYISQLLHTKTSDSFIAFL